ncbi:hypothetical protein N9K77_00315 [bacterium]|nr:hypothetical protein [bacterium]
MDIGIEKAQKSIEEFILKSQINIAQIKEENRDYKSELLMLFQEILQIQGIDTNFCINKDTIYCYSSFRNKKSKIESSRAISY